MSYNIHLTVDTGGPEPATVWDGWNYTTNCAPMWRAAGADLADFDGKTAADCQPTLDTAIAELAANRAKYEAMNPPNGWGSYSGLLPGLRRLSGAFSAHPRATVRVSH